MMPWTTCTAMNKSTQEKRREDGSLLWRSLFNSWRVSSSLRDSSSSLRRSSDSVRSGWLTARLMASPWASLERLGHRQGSRCLDLDQPEDLHRALAAAHLDLADGLGRD